MEKTKWENAGFERNEKGEVWLIWECKKCGGQFLGGMNTPECNCPDCVRRKAEMENWKIVSKDGNPDKAGVYDVVLIYDETKTEYTGPYVSDRTLVPTGRKFATRDSRYFGDAERVRGWIMVDQPDHGLVWSEETGSRPNESVYAWLPMRDFPDIELPDGVEWEKEEE